MVKTVGSDPEQAERPRQLRFYYHLSRVALAVGSLIVLFFSPQGSLPVAVTAIVVVWLILGVVGMSRETNRRDTRPSRIHRHFAADLMLLGLGTALGLPTIIPQVSLHVVIVFACLLFRPLVAVLYTVASGAIIIFGLGQWGRFAAGDFSGLVQPLITVTGIFAAVMALDAINRSARLGASRLSQTRIRLSDLRQINRATIEKLDVGIAVVDNTLAIRQINDSARGMIGSLIKEGRVAGKLARKLIETVNSATPSTMTTNVGHGILEIQAIPLHDSVLVKVENRTEVALKLRETRLAASGRLSSSIAHEIRNPLNAINHAAQILSLDTASDSHNGRILREIRERARHIDQIVESVLQRSRTGDDESTRLELTHWLSGFANGFRSGDGRTVNFRITGRDVIVTFDPMQLEQILLNLCKSMVERSNTMSPEIELEFHTLIDDSGNPHLEVVEHGRPLDGRSMEASFESFQGDGSDADLYLVREICTINGALVEYFHESLRGGFRVSFLAQDNQEP